jgi:uncharacterized phage protein (TIGR01671 family)
LPVGFEERRYEVSATKEHNHNAIEAGMRVGINDRYGIKCHWKTGEATALFILRESFYLEDTAGIIFDLKAGRIMLGSSDLYRATGFIDVNGSEIFEGDILSYEFEADGEMYQSAEQVFWNTERGAWCIDVSFYQDKTEFDYLADIDPRSKIIGNIVHNPELLKGGQS